MMIQNSNDAENHTQGWESHPQTISGEGGFSSAKLGIRQKPVWQTWQRGNGNAKEEHTPRMNSVMYKSVFFGMDLVANAGFLENLMFS